MSYKFIFQPMYHGETQLTGLCTLDSVSCDSTDLNDNGYIILYIIILLLTGMGILDSSLPMQFFMMLHRLML